MSISSRRQAYNPNLNPTNLNITIHYSDHPTMAPNNQINMSSPWPRPISPTTQLRHSFRAFCAAENDSRARRNEVPFCSASGRDRAFEKLMRLSRGEEARVWDGSGWANDWYEDSIAMERRREAEIMMNKQRKTNGQDVPKGHERKDSKEVADDGESWGKMAVAMGLGMQGVKLSDGEGTERREKVDVDMDAKK
jgi:hypothetical protein